MTETVFVAAPLFHSSFASVRVHGRLSTQIFNLRLAFRKSRCSLTTVCARRLSSGSITLPMPKKSLAGLERAGALVNGDPLPLLDRLGSPGLTSLISEIAALQPLSVSSLTQLVESLEDYRDHCLVAVEWPAVYAAFHHASQGRVRELISLDHEFQMPPGFASFANASLRTGKLQLERLKPLRDQRLLQNYRKAVLADNAKGWHVVVYGLFLSLYSLPLRQGLLHYAHTILRSLVESAAGHCQFPENQVSEALAKLESSLPADLESLLSRHSHALTVAF